MKFPEILLKNKKYLIILVVGIILLLIGNMTDTKPEKQTESSAYKIDEKKLVTTLENIEGAGKVKLFIRYENDGEKRIAQQITTSENENEVTPESVNDDFYVLSVRTPEIAGVLITATGASDETVRERILRGAKYALGVPYHRISVEWGK